LGLSTLKVMAALGIGVVLFAIALFVIHVSIRTIGILAVIGGGLTAGYFYIDYLQHKPVATKEMCKCNVCDHKNEITCVDQHCACCTVEKDGRYEHGVSTLT